MTNPFRRKTEVTINYAIVTPVYCEAGDTLVVQCERRVPRDVFLKLQAQLKEKFPGSAVILLESGLRVSGVIAGKEEAKMDCPCGEGPPHPDDPTHGLKLGRG